MVGTQRRLNELKKAATNLLKKNELETAWLAISEILNMDFDDPQGLYLAGVFFRNKGHSGASANFFRRAAAMSPKQINTWLFFGATLHDLHHYDEAMEVFKMAKQLNPEEPQVYANMAASMTQMGRFADALNFAHEALKRNPENRTALACRGMAYLGLGRWRDGFKDYKHIYGSQVMIRVYRQPEEPEWDGTQGKTVVVQGDQGLGDEIMYSSVLPDMAKDCKKVILDCHPKLEAVFKRSFPEIDVYGTKKQKTGVTWIDDYEIDAHYHISGLGRFYRTKDKDFPRKPFLIPNEELRLKWREKLKDLPKPWVGIAWQGGIVGTMREFRSIDPQDWLPVIEQGGSFIDLSYHNSEKEIEGLPIHKFEIDNDDYDDTLALLAELDLVVTVTTTIVHACGAIGQKAFVLVNKMPQWRYGVRRDDMQWYGKEVKLFRQEQEEQDFTGVIGRISEAYKVFLEDHSGVHRVRPEGGGSLPQLQSEHHPEQQPSGVDHAGIPAAA